jgi:predicted SnoaL-like aldol condensation-catalyzing enzyme
MISEGNFIAVQAEGEKAGKPFVFYDICRLKDGQIVEYWCVEQEVPATMPQTNGMI